MITVGIAYLAALALAAVLFRSGIAKLADPAPAEAAVRAARLPLARPIAVGLPFVEIGVASGLVVWPAAAALVALPLLVGFIVLVHRLLAAGSTVACGCFGVRRPDPVSRVDLVRNGLLVGLGVAAVGGSPVVPALADVIGVSTAIAIGVVVLSALRMHLEVGQFLSNRLPGGT